MKSISLPDKVEDILPSLIDLVRRSIDGTVSPLFVDYENFKVIIRETTASAASSVLEIALWGRITTAGVTTLLSTANFNSAINITGTTNSSGTSNWTNVTAGGLNITSTANFRSDINVTGNTESTGTVNIKANLTASALDILSEAPSAPRANTLWKDNIIKAWVQFSGGAVIRDSFNVSSITDNAGAGDWTVNWDVDFANTNYAVVASCGNADGGVYDIYGPFTDAPAVGSFRFVTVNNGTNGAANPDWIMVVAIGDQ